MFVLLIGFTLMSFVLYAFSMAGILPSMWLLAAKASEARTLGWILFIQCLAASFTSMYAVVYSWFQYFKLGVIDVQPFMLPIWDVEIFIVVMVLFIGREFLKVR